MNKSQPVNDMTQQANGILPASGIRDLVDKRHIFAGEDGIKKKKRRQSSSFDLNLDEETWSDVGGIDDNQYQPASLDVRLGKTALRVRASFLPGTNASVMDKISQLNYHQIDLTKGAVLETGCVYLVPLMEELALPKHISAFANPKSSTGRIDVFTRLITDGSGEFDKVPAGYKGRLYLEISPRTFPIFVRAGSRLAQMRFRQGAATYCDDEMKALHKEIGLVDKGTPNIDGGLALSVDLEGDGANAPVGWRAKRHAGLIRVDDADALEVNDYWEPIYPDKRKRLILDPDEFYILASREAVTIPPSHAAEMVPFNPLVGEFRVHYAGFFDPGFGAADAGGAGSRAVLEVRSREVPFILEHGQIIGRLIYERLTEPPDMLYGAALNSNYQSQGLRLSKHFKQEKIKSNP